MSIHLRKLISSKINELTPVKHSIAGLLELKQNKQGQIELKLPLKTVKDLRPFHDVVSSQIAHESIENVSSNNSEVSFTINREKLINEVFSNPTDTALVTNPEKLIVEFSSPNIAKPFHLGHLRSTIIGNFLSNLLTSVNHNVTKMNYLGDYGTQFGFLKVGIEMEQLTEEQIRKSPLECLFKAYVTANTSPDPSTAEKARKVFETMENSENEEISRQWEQIKRYTMDELKQMYQRLNVVFDVYEFESMYRRKEIENVIKKLKQRNLLKTEIDGKLVVEVGDRRVPIVKSDKTTLYLTRDIAAILERLKKFKMDKIYYVVDNGQNDHFVAIRSIMRDLGHDADSLIHHIKFGRIRGMSTRKGSVVFLKDILDEARDLMFKKQMESATTKVDLTSCGESVAEILGTSAVIVNDLKQKRTRDYEFDWNKVLQVSGDTGIKLQYTHCRLVSLSENCKNINEAPKLDTKFLPEPEAQRVIFEILRYPEILFGCLDTLEACGLVNYLFSLCNCTSRALKTLNVKNAPDDVASQRLLLFNTSRKIVKHGLEILGLKVLNEM